MRKRLDVILSEAFKSGIINVQEAISISSVVAHAHDMGDHLQRRFVEQYGTYTRDGVNDLMKSAKE